MSSGFTVLVSPHFERLAKRLIKQQPDFTKQLQNAVAILESDPYNLSRKHPILKLTGEQPEKGQWRLRLARWRFRYDIKDQTVKLKYCGLRRENTY